MASLTEHIQHDGALRQADLSSLEMSLDTWHMSSTMMLLTSQCFIIYLEMMCPNTVQGPDVREIGLQFAGSSQLPFLVHCNYVRYFPIMWALLKYI